MFVYASGGGVCSLSSSSCVPDEALMQGGVSGPALSISMDLGYVMGYSNMHPYPNSVASVRLSGAEQLAD